MESTWIADTNVQRAAEEIVEWNGDNALEIVREHIAAFSTAQDQSEINIAQRVLSEVETPHASKRS